MAKPGSTRKPTKLLNDLVTDIGPRLEAGLEKLAARGVRSDAFTHVMHGALGASIAGRRIATGVQDRILEALGLPTRTDIGALAHKLQSVEDRLISLAADLARVEAALGSAVPARPMPPRTRQAVALPPPQAPVAATGRAPRRRKDRP